MVSKIKLGLALGGGSARGLAHIGVLEVLAREGIHVDMIAGTSMGAAIGAAYAHGQNIECLKSLASEVKRRHLEILSVLTLNRTGFVNSRKIETWLKNNVGDTRIEELKIPFACVAVDIMTGEVVIIKRGPVWEAVRASASIPALFTLKLLAGRYLVDGGVSNPVPVDVVKEMGADFVIAVNVMRNVVKSWQQKQRRPGRPNIFTIAINSIYISNYHVAEASLRGADVAIEPDLEGIAYGDFQKAEICITKGREAAELALPAIKAKILSVR